MKIVGSLNQELKTRPYIHRIELLDRFYEILDSKKFVFVNPDKWEDPLENLIFNSRVIMGGDIFKNPAKDMIFSQCWSYEGDSYALWKIYTTKSNDKGEIKRHMGVRITTHLKRLAQISKSNMGQFYYGIIDYKWKNQMDELPKKTIFKNALRDIHPNKNHIKTLLVKRKSYSYEKEVRLFAIPSSSFIDKMDKQICRLNLNPIEFISSLRFDPGMEYKEFKKNKEKLIHEYGFKPSQITQSTYFKKNNYIINLDK